MGLGIQVFNNNRETTFDSSKGHLLIDLNYDPKRFNTIELTPNDLTSAGNGDTVYETLVTIEHGLPYIPKVDMYFYVQTASFSSDAFFNSVGEYAREDYYYTGSAVLQDRLFYEVDEEEVRIRHSYMKASVGSGASTSSGRDFIIKYYIYNLSNNPEM